LTQPAACAAPAEKPAAATSNVVAITSDFMGSLLFAAMRRAVPCQG
jgi:hypothetical protein